MQRIGLEAVLGMTNWNQGVAAYTGSIDSMNRKTGGFASVLGGIGRTIAGVGVAAAGLAVGGIALAAKALSTTIGPASNLAESMNKVMVVFGETGDEMVAWSKTAATAMGLSQQQALEAAGTYGNLFSAMGLVPEVAADMSQELVLLAADLGSFNNIPIDLALEKLRAGLVGEVEPLRTLGVNLSADAVKAKALDMGLLKASVDMTKVKVATSTLSKAQAAAAAAMKKHGEGSQEYRDALLKVETAEANISRLMQGKVGDLTAAQKAQAAYALIMEQTSLAQGDFERTSKGLANQQKILRAQFENIKGTIGTALLPAITELTGRFTGLLQTPAFQAGLERFTKWLTENLPKAIGVLSELGGKVVGFVVEMGKLAWEKWMGWWDEHGPAITTALGALWDWVSQLVTSVAGFVTEMGKLAWQAWLGWWSDNGPRVSSTLSDLWQSVSNIAQTLGAFVADMGRLAWNTWLGWIKDNGPAVKEAGLGIGEALKSIASSVSELLSTANQTMKLGNVLEQLVQWSQEDSLRKLQALQFVLEGVAGALEKLAGLVGITKVEQKVIQTEALEEAAAAGAPPEEILAEKLPVKPEQIIKWPTAKEWMDAFTNQGGLGGMQGIIDLLTRTLVPGSEEAGANIVDGLIRGVSAAWPSLEAFMADMAAKLPKVFNAVIQAKSPSKVFIEVGENITKGLQIGMGATPTASMGAMSAAHAVGAVGAVAAPSRAGGRVTNVGGDTIVQNISDPVSFYLAQAMVQDRKRSRWNEAMGVA